MYNKRGFTIYNALAYVICIVVLLVFMGNLIMTLTSNKSSEIYTQGFLNDASALYLSFDKDSLTMQNIEVTDDSLSYSVGVDLVTYKLDDGKLTISRGGKKQRFQYIDYVDFTKLTQFCYKDNSDISCVPTSKVLEVYVALKDSYTGELKIDGLQSRRGFYIENLK